MIHPKQILKQIGLTESEITVYLAMLSGHVQARDIIKATAEKRPTVYYALSSLERRGLISKQAKQGSHGYHVEPIKRLEAIAEAKKQEAEMLLSSIQNIAPLLAQGVGAESAPTVTFFEGKKAVKNVVMESMYCKSKQIRTIVPEDNFFISLGRDFSKQFVQERIDRKIATENLWTFETDRATFRTYYEGVSDVRILPDVMKGAFRTSILMYDEVVLYISSTQNNYCIKVSSKEHNEMMNALFTGLWGTSRQHRT